MSYESHVAAEGIEISDVERMRYINDVVGYSTAEMLSREIDQCFDSVLSPQSLDDDLSEKR